MSSIAFGQAKPDFLGELGRLCSSDRASMHSDLCRLVRKPVTEAPALRPAAPVAKQGGSDLCPAPRFRLDPRDGCVEVRPGGR
jgi:hypothetical protein